MITKATLLGIAICLTAPLPAVADESVATSPSGYPIEQASPYPTEGQIAKELEKAGYSNVDVTPNSPNPADPAPQRSEGLSAEEIAAAPAHVGWNGRATAPDGGRVDVYVDAAGKVTTRR
jgi:hypothetical protein